MVYLPWVLMPINPCIVFFFRSCFPQKLQAHTIGSIHVDEKLNHRVGLKHSNAYVYRRLTTENILVVSPIISAAAITARVSGATIITNVLQVAGLCTVCFRINAEAYNNATTGVVRDVPRAKSVI
jgi:hypothetical protein